MQQWQKYAAEAFGTMVLVGIGTGAILAALATGTATQAAVPLAFGLALLVALYAVGEVSGGHFNPAVSLGAFLDGRINVSDLVGYWVSQFAGGIIGSWIIAVLVNRFAVGATYTSTSVGTADPQLFFGEVVFTTIFVFVILSVTRKGGAYNNQAFLAISLTLAAVHFIGVPLTGASVNPARSFAPFVIGRGIANRADLWIYLVAPLAGAVVGWILYKIIVTGDVNFKDDMTDIKDRVTE